MTVRNKWYLSIDHLSSGSLPHYHVKSLGSTETSREWWWRGSGGLKSLPRTLTHHSLLVCIFYVSMFLCFTVFQWFSLRFACFVFVFFWFQFSVFWLPDVLHLLVYVSRLSKYPDLLHLFFPVFKSRSALCSQIVWGSLWTSLLASLVTSVRFLPEPCLFCQSCGLCWFWNLSRLKSLRSWTLNCCLIPLSFCAGPLDQRSLKGQDEVS